MKLFLCVALVLGSVLGLGSFAPTSVPTKTGTLTVAQLPMNRAFHLTGILPANATNTAYSLALPLPATAGVVLREIRVPAGGFEVIVDGVSFGDIDGSSNGGLAIQCPNVFDPPLVVPPGSVLTITAIPAFPPVSPPGTAFTISGWNVYPGEV